MTEQGRRSDVDSKALRAMRRLLDRFGGFGPGEWLFDGEPVSDEVAEPLLFLTDNLNEYDAARTGE